MPGMWGAAGMAGGLVTASSQPWLGIGALAAEGPRWPWWVSIWGA